VFNHLASPTLNGHFRPTKITFRGVRGEVFATLLTIKAECFYVNP
jgi:hypothetical protein